MNLGCLIIEIKLFLVEKNQVETKVIGYVLLLLYLIWELLTVIFSLDTTYQNMLCLYTACQLSAVTFYIIHWNDIHCLTKTVRGFITHWNLLHHLARRLSYYLLNNMHCWLGDCFITQQNNMHRLFMRLFYDSSNWHIYSAWLEGCFIIHHNDMHCISKCLFYHSLTWHAPLD